MMNRLFFVSFLLISLNVAAQKKSNPSVYAKTITAQDLRNNLNVIASAEMEGRNTPSPGLEKAADYIIENFKKYGLQPGNGDSFRQTYKLTKSEPGEMSLTIDGTNFKPYEDFAPGMGMPNTLDMEFTSYVFVGYGIVDEKQDDYKGADVKGKLVIFINGEPKGYTPSKTGSNSPTFIFNKIRTAFTKGAAAVLIIREDLPSRLSAFSSYRPETPNPRRGGVGSYPVFFINENVVQRVSGYDLNTVIQAIGTDVSIPLENNANIRLKNHNHQSVDYASNIVGIVEGSDKKDEYLVISAHYDHVGKDNEGNIYYGADDDGSGTVGLMELAEAFATAKKKGAGPRRTVVFLAVSGEEKGLWGSEYYTQNPIYPLNKTSADLNIDMIGRIGSEYLNKKDAENYLYIIGDDKLSTDLAPLTDKVNNEYVNMKLDRKYNDPNDPERFYYRSDHYNFAAKGVPVIFYFNGVHADYHKPTDTVDKIHFDLMAKRTQLVFYTAWEIANREALLKRDLELPAPR